jgi:hypothetical protein
MKWETKYDSAYKDTIFVGEQADIAVLDRTGLNLSKRGRILTSMVIAHNQTTGVFETGLAIYRPVTI